MIPSDASWILPLRCQVIPSNATSIPPFRCQVIPSSATSIPFFRCQITPSNATLISPLHCQIIPSNATSIPPLHCQIMLSCATSIPPLHFQIIPSNATSIPPLHCQIMLSCATSIPPLHCPIIPSNATSTPLLRCQINPSNATSMPPLSWPVVSCDAIPQCHVSSNKLLHMPPFYYLITPCRVGCSPFRLFLLMFPQCQFFITRLLHASIVDATLPQCHLITLFSSASVPRRYFQITQCYFNYFNASTQSYASSLPHHFTMNMFWVKGVRLHYLKCSIYQTVGVRLLFNRPSPYGDRRFIK